MTQKVGDLNGKWSILMRVALVAVPMGLTFAMSYGIHVENNLDDLQRWRNRMQESRWTALDQAAFERRLIEMLNQKVDASQVPPQWFKDQVNQMAARVEENSKQIREVATDVRVIRNVIERKNK